MRQKYWNTNSAADPGCLSRIPDPIFSIPDPNSFHPGSRIRIKEFKYRYFTPKKLFLSTRKYDLGCSSRIRILSFYPHRIRNTGILTWQGSWTGSAGESRGCEWCSSAWTTGGWWWSRPEPRPLHHTQKPDSCYNSKMAFTLPPGVLRIQIRTNPELHQLFGYVLYHFLPKNYYFMPFFALKRKNASKSLGKFLCFTFPSCVLIFLFMQRKRLTRCTAQSVFVRDCPDFWEEDCKFLKFMWSTEIRIHLGVAGSGFRCVFRIRI